MGHLVVLLVLVGPLLAQDVQNVALALRHFVWLANAASDEALLLLAPSDPLPMPLVVPHPIRLLLLLAGQEPPIAATLLRPVGHDYLRAAIHHQQPIRPIV